MSNDESQPIEPGAEAESEAEGPQREADRNQVLNRLALDLVASPGLVDALEHCLDAAFLLSDADAGGIYLVNAETGAVELACFRGLSSEFVARSSFYEADSPNAKLIHGGKPVYGTHSDLVENIDSVRSDEGLLAIGVVPVNYQDRPVAAINVASHSHSVIPSAARDGLENLAAQIGSAIARFRAEEALRKSEEKYRLLVERSPFAVVITDVTGKVIEANQRACEATGMPKEQIIGAQGMERLIPRDEATIRKISDNLINPSAVEGIVVETKKGRSLRVSTVVFSQDPLLLYSTFEDITEQRRLQQQLQQSQKMEAIGRLAGGVAHDMNNILGAIMGSASMLKLETPEDDRRAEDIATILDACRKGRSLTRDLLGFARKGKYIKERISLNDVAKEAEALLTRTISKKIVVEMQLNPELEIVEGDRSQIVHALMNVCINAADAMRDVGTLNITTKNVTLDRPPEAAVSEFTPGRYVRLDIVDTGVGMSKEMLKQVFEPFFTTKEKGQGTGLGLSMVYGVVKNHGGLITIESEERVGTTVSFFLPVLKHSSLEIVEAKQRQLDTLRGQGGILVVDDEEMVRNSTRRLLVRLGYTVLVAASGQEALILYRENRREISLVILDLIMPEMDGVETFEALRAIDDDVRVLISSGYSKDERVERMLSRGKVGFVSKPFDAAALAEHVNKAMP